MTFFDWRYLFNEIFQDYPDNWRLDYVHRNNLDRIRSLQNSRKMNREKLACFTCKRCSNTWLSSKAQVIFYYPNKKPLGRVTMQVFGQQCRKCSQRNGPYVDPIFGFDTIEAILEKLYELIGQNCYNKRKPSKKRNDANDEEKEENPYDAKGEHESDLCEACKLRICTYQRKIR